MSSSILTPTRLPKARINRRAHGTIRSSSNAILMWLAVGLFMFSGTRTARSGGGLVLLHQVRGPYSVTVFGPSEIVRNQPADLSVLVQRQENGDPVLDADVSLALEPVNRSPMVQSDPLCGSSSALGSFPLPKVRGHPVRGCVTREQAVNKLLYAAPVVLNTAGNWRLHVSVSHGSVNADFDCVLSVSEASAGSSGLWPYLAFPPIAIVAFGMNQWLRKSVLENA